MAKRTTYHVTFKNGKWRVKRRGARRAASAHRKKSAAVRKGRALAKRNTPSELVIHKKSGGIADKRSYGTDPSRIRG